MVIPQNTDNNKSNSIGRSFFSYDFEYLTDDSYDYDYELKKKKCTLDKDSAVMVTII